MTNRNLPILTANGLTAVEQYHNWDRSKHRPEEYLQSVEGTVRANTLTKFAHIDTNIVPEPWEFWYIRPNCTYEQWYAARDHYVGWTTICGNLEELSYAFRFHTKDPEIIARFTDAFESNKAWPGISQYHHQNLCEFNRKKKVYEALVAKGTINACDA